MQTPSLRQRAALAATRRISLGLLAVGLAGAVGAVVAFRADVAEARAQVRDRIQQQGRVYADSLGLYFELLRAELQRVADRPLDELRAGAPGVLAEIQSDRSLLGGGVTLFGADGRVVWHDGPDAAPDAHRPWFQRLLAGAPFDVDAHFDGADASVSIALAVRHGRALEGILVGVARASDRLVYGVEMQGEHLLLLSSNGRVVVPVVEPDFARSPTFGAGVEALERSAEPTVVLAGQRHIAQLFRVHGTALRVLALEAEAAAIGPIERRFGLQLVFLLVLQLGTLGVFALLVRRTHRVLVDAEASIASQETMAALGSAASLIAHEVKNSLNGMKGAVALLEAGGDERLVARTLRGQTDRLDHLAKSLLSFARPNEPQRVPTALDELVREVVDGLGYLPEFDETQLRLELQPTGRVLTDPLLLMTALDNVVRNAMEAAVAAKDMGRSATAQVVLRLSVGPDGAVIAVEDNAGGPPPEFERSWGQPFVTGKPKGVGLGLAMARRALERIGGALRFERTADGSRFTLRLPAPLADTEPAPPGDRVG